MGFSRTKRCAAALVLAAAPAGAQVDPLAPLPDPVEASPPPVAVPATRPAPPPLIQRLPTSPAATLPAEPMTAVSLPQPAAPSTEMGFAGYKLRLAALGRSAGIREATIRATVPFLALNARVIQLDRSQPGGPPNSAVVPPFAPYRRDHVTANLISRGRQVYADHYRELTALQARTGVDAFVPVAIFGHETSYGAVTGGFDLLDALATMAYEGRRRELFEREFVAALTLLDRGTPRARLKGSWAGATGYPQFMPSAVLKIAADGDGDGRADIWSSKVDALASIAAFLKDAGWKAGMRWGVAVRVPRSLDRSAVRNTVTAPRCPRVFARHSRWLTMREWRALGVQPIGEALPDGQMASLLEPDGREATAYLLTANYRVILEYNCSNFYALAVGLLADAIAGR